MIRKKILLVVFFFSSLVSFAQKTGEIHERMHRLHDLMVKEPYQFYIDLYLHDSLKYGHSNGWIESRKEFQQNLASKHIVYHSFNETDVRIDRVGKTACIRFKAEIDVTLKGKRATYHLNVLEVWAKKGLGSWKLLSRQAVKG